MKLIIVTVFMTIFILQGSATSYRLWNNPGFDNTLISDFRSAMKNSRPHNFGKFQNKFESLK